MEPEPFADYSGPKTLDVNRGAGHGLVGEEEEDTDSMAGLAGVCECTASELGEMGSRSGLLR